MQLCKPGSAFGLFDGCGGYFRRCPAVANRERRDLSEFSIFRGGTFHRLDKGPSILNNCIQDSKYDMLHMIAVFALQPDCASCF